MEDLAVKLLLGIVILAGALGSALPVMPGKPVAFAALLLAKIFDFSSISWWVIVLFGILTVVGIILDYLLPIVTTKKLGGTKYGIWGLVVGLIVGIIFSPIGFLSIIILPFLGALAGELIYDFRSGAKAVKAASGSLLSYFLTSFYGIVLCIAMFLVFLFTDIL